MEPVFGTDPTTGAVYWPPPGKPYLFFGLGTQDKVDAAKRAAMHRWHQDLHVWRSAHQEEVRAAAVAAHGDEHRDHQGRMGGR